MSDRDSEILGGDVVDLARHLVSIDSQIGDERALCDDLERRFRIAGMHRVERASNSLCVVPRPLRDGHRRLMLVGHLDTVPKLSENPVRIEDDRLYGLGASDMKGADAVMIRALARAIADAPRHDLIGVLYSREEGPFAESEMPHIRDAAPDLFENVDLAIAMEPTDGHIEMGALGTCHATVTFVGQRAHSARPWQGDNAIHKAHGLLARLAALDRAAHEFHGLTFYEVLSATMIDYRGARNVVPDRCTVNVNYRFAPGRAESDVRNRLDEVVAAEGTWELTDYCPAGLVCGDNELLAELHRAAPEAEVGAKQAWTDVGRLSHWGIDAINWGPGQRAQAHQEGEWASVAAIREAARVLDRWLFDGPG